MAITALLHKSKVTTDNSAKAMATGKRNLDPASLVLTTRHDAVVKTLNAGASNVTRAKEAARYAANQLSTILSQLNHIKGAVTQSQGLNDLQTLARIDDSVKQSIETVSIIVSSSEFSGQKLLDFTPAAAAAPDTAARDTAVRAAPNNTAAPARDGTDTDAVQHKTFNINTGSGTTQITLENIEEIVHSFLKNRGKEGKYQIDVKNAEDALKNVEFIDNAIIAVQNALSKLCVQEEGLVDTTQSLKDAIDAEKSAQQALDQVDYTEEMQRQIEANTATSAAISAMIVALRNKKEHADRAINAMG